MGVYLRAKFENASIILAGFRQGGGGVILPPTPTSRRTPKKPTQNSINVLRYAYVRYVKILFTNIQKQQNKIKISLLFKKLTNFTGK